MRTKILVDSNILFSAILNSESRIGQLILNGQSHYAFYAPKYSQTELLKHKDKIMKLANLSDNEFNEVYHFILKGVILLHHSLLTDRTVSNAYKYCKDIDIDDTIFVAFSQYLKCKLWTGDKKLIQGLDAKGYKNTITTEALYEDFIKNGL